MRTPSSKSPNANRSGGAAPSRMYGLVITSLAIFLTGLILWRTPVAGYQATAELVAITPPTSIDAPPADDTTLREELLSESHAGRLLERIGDRRLEIDDLRQRLTFKSISDGGEPTISISYRGASHAGALNVVNEVAQQAVETLSFLDAPAADESQSRQARWQAIEARHYEERARQELDNFVENNLSALSATTVAYDSAGADTEVKPAPPTAQLINPAWRTANENLQALRSKLEKMMVDRQAAHPEIRQLEWDIEAAKLQLAQIPQFEPEGSADSSYSTGQAPQPSTSGPPKQAASRSAAGANKELTDKYHQLRAEYEKAVQKRKAAEELAFVDPQETQTSPAARSAWVLRPATEAIRLGGAPTQFQILVLGVAALVGGCIVFATAGAERTVRVFTSIEQIESALGLPVVGRLFDESIPLRQKPAAGGGFARRAVKLCELAIALLLVLFFVSSLGSPTAAQEFTTDPLSAISQSLARIAQWRQ